MRLRKASAKLLARERVCRVATAGKVSGKIYFATGGDSQKVRHLRANPHLAVLVDLYTDDWSWLKGVMVQGTARLLRRGPEFRKIRTLLYKKYPYYPDESAVDESDDIIVEVTPARVASWGLEDPR